jgi:hypothetical protein
MNLDLYLEMGMIAVGRLIGISSVKLKYLTGIY